MLISLFKYAVIICLLLCSTHSKGQTFDKQSLDDQYNDFRKTFMEEIKRQQIESPYSGPAPCHISPSALPAWFSSIPEPGINYFYAVGISDPDCKVNACEQAIERALGIGLLLQDMKAKHLKDVFSGEYENLDFLSKFEELYHFCRNHGKQKHVYEIIKTDSSKFGEMIVLLKISAENASPDSKADSSYSIYCFNMEYESSGKYEMNSKIEVFRNQAITVERPVYTWNEIGRAAGIKSMHEGELLPVEASFFRYKSNADSFNINSDHLYGRKLQYGLWFGYLNSILKSIQSRLKPEDIVLKNVEEHYSRRFRDLTREIAIINSGFNISNIYVYNNEIFVDLQNTSTYEKD